jgi:hypothetical protein
MQQQHFLARFDLLRFSGLDNAGCASIAWLAWIRSEHEHAIEKQDLHLAQ